MQTVSIPRRRSYDPAKTAALILAAVLLFLCGCRDKKASESGEPRQMLVIGSDIYAPYFYIGENGDFARRGCGNSPRCMQEA